MKKGDVLSLELFTLLNQIYSRAGKSSRFAAINTVLLRVVNLDAI